MRLLRGALCASTFTVLFASLLLPAGAAAHIHDYSAEITGGVYRSPCVQSELTTWTDSTIEVVAGEVEVSAYLYPDATCTTPAATFTNNYYVSRRDAGEPCAGIFDNTPPFFDTAAVPNAYYCAVVFHTTPNPPSQLMGTESGWFQLNAAGDGVQAVWGSQSFETVCTGFTNGWCISSTPDAVDEGGVHQYAYGASFPDPTSSSFSYSTAGTGAAPANADDFGGTLPNGTLNFDPFANQTNLFISSTDDADPEPDEDFEVVITSAEPIVQGTATGTILDNDAAPTLEIPTLGETALMVLVGLLGVAGAIVLRRRT